MKSLSLSILFAFLAIFSFSQENSNTLRPGSGNFSFEVNLMPFGQDQVIDITGFRGRIFVEENLALRLGANLDLISKNYETPVMTYDNLLLYEQAEEKATTLGVNFGIEYHFLDSRRISPYAGFEVNVVNKSSSATYDQYSQIFDPFGNNSYELIKLEYENMWEPGIVGYYYDPYNNSLPILSEQQRAFLMLGANLVMGTDIYIAKHFYMGFEFGFGYDFFKYKEAEFIVDGIVEEKTPVAKTNEINFKANNAIRMGVWF